MLSIVICSISAERLARIKENISATVGRCEYEIIAIDNNELHGSITEVYNRGAGKAKFPYLLFIHEDVIFHTAGWGNIIEKKLAEPDCGVIGFAGSKIKLRSYSGWYQIYEYTCTLLYQLRGNSLILESANVPADKDFDEVCVLDGLAMFVRRDVWQEYRFDDVNLKGFHCYDIDFSLRIAAERKYRNYVCCTPLVMVEHYSGGTMNSAWYRDTIKMHKTVWKELLPFVTEDVKIDKREIERLDEKNFNFFVRRMIKAGYKDKWPIVREFLLHPKMSAAHFRHCLTVLWKCLPNISFPRSTNCHSRR